MEILRRDRRSGVTVIAVDLHQLLRRACFDQYLVEGGNDAPSERAPPSRQLRCPFAPRGVFRLARLANGYISRPRRDGGEECSDRVDDDAGVHWRLWLHSELLCSELGGELPRLLENSIDRRLDNMPVFQADACDIAD